MHTMDLTRDEPRDRTPAAAGAPTTHAALPAAVASWLQRVDAAAHPQPQLSGEPRDPKAAQNRFVYVLAPTSGGRHVALCLCKARLRPNGEVASASAVSEVFSLLSAPPGYLEGDDEDLVRFFIAMRSGASSQGGSATEPKGKVGAILLQMLLDQDKLLWANSWSDMAGGLLYPLKAGPVRQANLVWRDEGRTARLGWQVLPANGATHSAADQIDYMLPTDPPWYIDNLSCGALALNRGGVDIALPELQALVAQAPLLSGADKTRVSQLLLAHGLQHLMPLPQPLTQRLRDDVKPQPVLLLDSVALADGPGQRWQDYAQLSFDDDGERGSFDPAQRGVRQRGEVTEVIARDGAAEALALARLSELGFRKPGTAPLSGLAGALQLDSQAHWLRFGARALASLVEQGWQVIKSAKYRYDVVAVDDWYADVHEPQEAGRAWFELELGIVVNHKRVPLLPVLVQLIRGAPSDFDPDVLAAHADADQMLATLPDGVRVALPWARLKPILGTLGELYFSDKIKTSVRLSTLDAGRLDELARGVALRWEGGEQLRETGRKLAQFGAVQKVPAPAGLQATLRDYQADGLAWMQFLREYDLAGILADDMGLGKTVQTLAHILIEKEAGRLTHPALVIAPTSLMTNWQEEAARFAPGLRVLLLQGKERLDQFDKIDAVDLVLTTYALLPRDEEKLREHEFHLVILDESHYIKNTRSKAAQRRPAQGQASPVPDRHAAGKPSGRTVVAISLSVARPAGRREELQPPVPQSDRAAGRSAAARAAEPTHPPFPAAPYQGQCGQGAAAENRDGAQGRAVRRPARPVRDSAAGDGQEGARRDRQERCGAQPDRDFGGAAETAPGVLRPAPGEGAAVEEAGHRLGQADRPDADGRRPARRGPQDFGVLAVHQHARADRGRAHCAPHPVRAADGRDARPGRPSGRVSAGRGADLPDQPEGGRGRPEPDGGRHRDPLRPVVEPAGGKPGHRPRLADRPGQAGVRLQAHRQGHAGGKNPAAAAEKGRPGAIDPGRRRVGQAGADAGRPAGDLRTIGGVAPASALRGRAKPVYTGDRWFRKSSMNEYPSARSSWFREIAETGGDIGWVLDCASGELLYLSETVEALLGYSVAQAALLLSDAAGPLAALLAGLPERLRRFDAGDASRRRLVRHLELRHCDGSVVEVELISSLSAATPNVLLGVLRDLRVQRAREREQKRIISMLSHDFRTPLSTIDGAVQRLEATCKGADEATRQRYRKIQSACDRLIEMLDQYLSPDKMDAIGQIRQPTTLAPRALLEQGAAQARGAGRTVRIVADALPEQLRCDPNGLQLALKTLVDNALKYSPHVAALELLGQPAGEGGLELLVRDDGPGFAADELDAVFGRSVRGSAAGAVPGSGLGLYIARSVIESHGGTLTAHNRAAGGAELRIWLPAHQAGGK